jgi:hypothetical protein
VEFFKRSYLTKHLRLVNPTACPQSVVANICDPLQTLTPIEVHSIAVTLDTLTELCHFRTCVVESLNQARQRLALFHHLKLRLEDILHRQQALLHRRRGSV